MMYTKQRFRAEPLFFCVKHLNYEKMCVIISTKFYKSDYEVNTYDYYHA